VSFKEYASKQYVKDAIKEHAFDAVKIVDENNEVVIPAVEADALVLAAGENVKLEPDLETKAVIVKAADTKYDLTTNVDSSANTVAIKLVDSNETESNPVVLKAAGSAELREEDGAIVIHSEGVSNETFNELKNKVDSSSINLVKSGTAEDSIVIGDGTATAKHAIAGGTTDKSMITDLVGSVAGALVNLEPANAQAVGSLSFGSSTDSVAAGSMSIGVESVAGCLGYYIWDIDFNNKKITLSKNQHTSLTFTKTKPSNLTWVVNDMISIFYNIFRYISSLF